MITAVLFVVFILWPVVASVSLSIQRARRARR